MSLEAAPQGLTLASAFLLGLLGNVHCIAMCGGIVAAFSHGLPGSSEAAGSPGAALARSLPYNLGRLASYTVAGAIAGAAGFVVADALGAGGTAVLRGLFGVLMVAVGLYLAGFGAAVAPLERLARPLWKLVSRGVPRLRPADRLWKALALGAIWGWLPCGLVYAALLGAAATGAASHGALLMLCFGAGTLPILLAAGALAARMRGVLARGSVRAAAGIAVAVFGLWTLGGAALGFRHFEHMSQPAVGSGDGGHAHHHE